MGKLRPLDSELDLDQEPLPPVARALVGAGAQAPDFEATLTNSHTVQLAQLAAKGPVLLNFIKGTWCPFCQKHLFTLRNWQETLSRKNSTILVLSSEGIDSIWAWLSENPMPYLFAAPLNADYVFRSYGVDVTRESFARPATFLIGPNMKILMSYGGTRGKKLTGTCRDCGLDPNPTK